MHPITDGICIKWWYSVAFCLLSIYQKLCNLIMLFFPEKKKESLYQNRHHFQSASNETFYTGLV